MTLTTLSQVDATPRPAPKLKGTPPGFFDDALSEANVCDLHL